MMCIDVMCDWQVSIKHVMDWDRWVPSSYSSTDGESDGMNCIQQSLGCIIFEAIAQYSNSTIL